MIEGSWGVLVGFRVWPKPSTLSPCEVTYVEEVLEAPCPTQLLVFISLSSPAWLIVSGVVFACVSVLTQ